MTVADGNILRVVATFAISSVSKAQNVYHMENTTGASISDAEAVTLAQEAVENLMAQLEAKIVSSVELDEVEVFERIAGSWAPVGSTSSTWVGTSGGDRPPSGEALMIELTKERTGYKDRKFICGIAEAGSVGDVYDAATLAAADDYVDEIQLEFTSSLGSKGKFIYFNRDTDATAYYTGGAGSPLVSYQRRRKPGVGLT